MSIQQPEAQPAHAALAEESVALVRRWLTASQSIPADPSAERLAGVLRDPNGLDFTIGFVDRVVRPEDLRVAARNLSKVSRTIPRFLPWYLRSAIAVGGALAPVLPWPIVPIARGVLRGMVGHLVIDATPHKLDTSLAKLRSQGVRLNLNLLGEAVLGDAEADRRLEGTTALLKRNDVDYVSIKVSSVASQLSMWAFDETVERVVKRLTPLYETAAASSTPKFINLDMEEFRDLDLTIAVFTKMLEQPKLRGLEAGIVLQAYLPDALAALQNLTEWATARCLAGGAAIKVRVVKGANLAMEHVDAAIHEWPVATWSTKRESDTNYKRVLDWALRPEHINSVRIGVAGHNLFDVAFAWLLAKERGVEKGVEFEMLLGMATGQADAVKRDVGGLLLYTPVVHPREFDSAISYLIRRLEENASTENFMSGLFELAEDERMFARERDRFLDSLRELDSSVPTSNRVQDRTAPVAEPLEPEGFHNEPDTDPAIAVNRTWGRSILERSAHSRLGIDTIEKATVPTVEELEKKIAATVGAGERWAALPATERARILHNAGNTLSSYRAQLIEVMASETGKTIAEGDVEVSEAIDFAHYYAEQSLKLDAVEGAQFVPSRLIVVTPPWNFPVAIPAGSVLSGLASGSGVIIKPARQARRSGSVMVEALWEAGVPRDLLTLVAFDDSSLGKNLVAHPSVDRVILTGGWDTAQMFRGWRPDLPLLAETSGKNAIIVTPSADLDLAVADAVKSAFGHAGQKCSAGSLVILVGSVGKSDRFYRQLVDAVETLKVGYPHDPTTQMGPIIEPANGKLLRALTTLQEGEEWLVEPRQLDDTGRLWSPGVKAGVAAGSEYHLTEYFGPVLGVMTARTLDEAMELQNRIDYGLTAGIHSLDADEVAHWLDSVQAGNLYVNRGITGAIVQRQPFGGWKRSSVGTGAKAGGPNYLMTLGDWTPVEVEPQGHLELKGVSRPVARVIESAQESMEFLRFDRVRVAARNDAKAWAEEFGVSRDVSNLEVERNVFRYRPAPVTLRLAEGAPIDDLVRLIAAGTLTRSPLHISSATPLPNGLQQLVGDFSTPVDVRSITIEPDASWHARVRAGELQTERVRLIGGDPAELSRAVEGDPDVAIYAQPVTAAGRVELLPFLLEQAVTITAHRFGNPDPSMEQLPV